jgi:hypothetical protein
MRWSVTPTIAQPKYPFFIADFQVNQAGVRVSSSDNATPWVVQDPNINITSSGNLIPRGNK